MSTNVFFDWSKLDRQRIIQHILFVENKLCQESYFADEFHKILSNNLKTLAPFKISKIYDHSGEKGLVYVGGLYYSDLDQENRRPIELQFIYNSKKDRITASKSRLKRIATLIADTALHEMIHMRQYRRREFKSLPEYHSRAEKSELREEQSYLGNSDEIDAYAFNIACELCSKFKQDETKINQYLNKRLKNHKFKNSWRLYLRAFEYDHNHPIIKRLKKKVIRYIPQAKLGRPYRTGDWINQ